MEIREVTDKERFNNLATHWTQCWQWGEFRLQTPSVKKVLRLGSFDGKTLQKVFQITIHKIPKLNLTIAYLPRSPLPTKEELTQIKNFCLKEKAIFLQIEPDLEGPDPLKLPGAVKTTSLLPKHTIFIDLSKSEEQLLSEMHEKTRYNIRLAIKKGVTVQEENNEKGMEKFIKLLTDTEKRQGFFAHSENYYRKLWKSFGETDMAKILFAYVPDVKEPVAGIMLYHFKDMLYYPYGGSNPEFKSFMAPQLLHFEAMKIGKKLHCKNYDLWGSYKFEKNEKDPWWGIYRLKSGLGGVEIDYPDTVDIPLSPLYKLYILGNALRWKALKMKRILTNLKRS